MQNAIGALRHRILSSGATEGKNIVAFSGGVDSSLVAALVHQAFPNNTLACVGVSAALPAAQLHLARSVARHIGITLKEVSTTEGSNPDYIANEGQSCFHCKTHLYSALEAVAAQAGIESRYYYSSGGESVGIGPSRTDVVLFNGTNKDDKRDPTRVGLKAAADFRVASPIDFLTKEEVRTVSRELGLPNWNHAASPCLRSRLAFGVQATPDRLAVIEKAEDAVRKLLGLEVSHNLRVRAMHGNKALLEVDEGVILQEARRAMPDIRSLILPLGFDEVDVRAFKSGAVSRGIIADGEQSTRLKGVVEKGSMGIDIYRVGGSETV